MEENGWGLAPSGAPPLMMQREEERWRHFDNSVNAVSFGFVATAILISMFLVMAIFERFLRPRSTDGRGGGRNAAGDLERGTGVSSKVGVRSPNMSIYAKGVSVLMPGQDVPTFIAHPAPPPCPPERISWPHHQQSTFSHPTSNPH
ncbi:uncharacterized protein LOC131230770 [Magnolia sinica]|uniref:uncharacterized protein LOC131230770 n=1 Tax=Magnolia sinica TaxID=86752 RepID=UPI00265A63D9|nr:uncharacterized protein LOC131230770 [Magnolia sinica]